MLPPVVAGAAGGLPVPPSCGGAAIDYYTSATGVARRMMRGRVLAMTSGGHGASPVMAVRTVSSGDCAQPYTGWPSDLHAMPLGYILLCLSRCGDAGGPGAGRGCVSRVDVTLAPS